MRRHATAVIENLPATQPAIGPSCQQLCAARDNDFDTLQNMQDFPASERARIRAAMLRDIRSLTAQLRAQGCPPATSRYTVATSRFAISF